MKWPVKKLGDICKFAYGDSLPKQNRIGGNIHVYGSNGIVGNHNQSITLNETIIVGRKGSAGQINWSSKSCYPIDTTYFIDKNFTDQNLRWLFWYLKQLRLNELNKAAAVPGLNRDDAYRIKILLPPLAEQQRIALLLDTADRILKQRESAIAKLDELAQSVFVDMFGNISNNNKKWPIHQFSKLADNEDYKRKPIKSSDRDNRGGAYPYYGASGIIDTIDEYIFEGDSLLIGEDGANLVARSSPIAFIARGKYWVNNHAHILRQNRNANIRYLEYFLLQIDLKPYVTGSAQPKLTRGNLDRILVPTPPIKLQNHFEKIIIELEAEKDVMNSNQRVALKLVSSLQHQSFSVN